MNPLLMLLLGITILFGGLAAFFSYLEEKRKKDTLSLKKQLSQRNYELSILKHLSEDIGYFLNVQKVAETIVSSINNVLTVSSVSYAILNQDKIVMKTYLFAQIGAKFVNEVRRITIDSLNAIDNKYANLKIVDTLQGQISDVNDTYPLSYFNIPLVVNNEFAGIITIASKYKEAYQEDEMTALYKLISQATKTVEKLEEVIETEKSKLNSMLLSIPSGAIVFLLEQDDTLRLTTINSAAKEFLHIEGEVDAIKTITSFGREFNLLNQIRSVLDQKKTLMTENVNLFGKTFKIFVNPVLLPGSKRILGASIIMEDLTVEKKIQEIRETFTNIVVHELRAPLTSIKGSAELLLSGKLDEKDKDRMLHLVKHSTETLLSDIGGLLDAAKIEAGKFVISKDIADLNKLISEKTETFSMVAMSKHIEIKSSLDKALPAFEFDRERIGQVLNNLLSNAIKFTHEGGEIDVTSQLNGNLITVKVKDNGAGIPENIQATLFKKFTQAGGATSRVGGTGLGLYISKSIIESHGGKIWLDSAETKGTTMYFTLPLLHPMNIQVAYPNPARTIN